MAWRRQYGEMAALAKGGKRSKAAKKTASIIINQSPMKSMAEKRKVKTQLKKPGISLD
jgi:hypothetical protein